jgi:hypothetical protein
MPAPEKPERSEASSLLHLARRWWLTPLLFGVVLAVAALVFGDFKPIVSRFYSVF